MPYERGDTVEIAPYRGGRFYYSYAPYDGCRGVVETLKGTNGAVKVRVKVKSKNPALAGGIDVPLQAVRPVEEEG